MEDHHFVKKTKTQGRPARGARCAECDKHPDQHPKRKQYRKKKTTLKSLVDSLLNEGSPTKEDW